MKRITRKRKVPVFVDVNQVRKTPKDPIILYFTKAYWHAIISKKRLLKRSSFPLERFQMRYQLAPWGNGDVIIYPNPAFRALECKPIMKAEIRTEPFKVVWVRVGFECKAKHCAIYTEAYPGKIPDGANGIGCDDEKCPGGCREIFVGTADEGYFTCRCGP
jgi:hypothetical protein